jgi:hypothetical protein
MESTVNSNTTTTTWYERCEDCGGVLPCDEMDTTLGVVLCHSCLGQLLEVREVGGVVKVVQ